MKKLLLLSVLFTCIAATCFAQSVQEIEAAKAMARQYGYSESEIKSIMNAQSKNETSALYNENIIRQAEYSEGGRGDKKDMTIQVQKLPAPVKSDIYGHDIFFSSGLGFIPSYNIPTPENYIIGPGDQVHIDIWGNAFHSYDLIVSPEGSIVIPNMGPVSIAGSNLKDAETILKRKLSTSYSGMGSSTFMSLSIGKIRSLTVNVVGDARIPGSYAVPSLSTICSAIYMANGVTEIGSVRNIRLFRQNKLVAVFDLYDFIMNGVFDRNVRLEDNDVIAVSSYQNIVEIEGKVKRPMKYEMIEGETLSDLIKYAGGLNEDASSGSVHIDRQSEAKVESFDVSLSEAASFVIKGGDHIYVNQLQRQYQNRVKIAGNVFYPGTYSISNNISNVKSLIESAGGVMDGTYMERAYVVRAGEDMQPVSISFSPEKVMAGLQDINLVRGDSVRVFSIMELSDSSMVEVFGEVNDPGKFLYRKGLTIGDVILTAGGLTDGATLSNIDVARRNKNNNSKFVSDRISEVFNLDAENDTSVLSFPLDPYDMVFIRKSPNYREQQTITVRGEVSYPGTYVIEKNTVRLSDVVKRAYNVTSDAYIKGAKLVRVLTQEEYNRLLIALQVAKNKTQDSTSIDILSVGDRFDIGIDLEKALNNPGSYSDVVLRTGDILEIPKMNNTEIGRASCRERV